MGESPASGAKLPKGTAQSVVRWVTRSVACLLVYVVIAVISFWSFGDHGVTVGAVLIAAAVNVTFGFIFGWRALWAPLLVFGAWVWSVDGRSGCENCDVVFDAGAYSVLFAGVGAAMRLLLANVKELRSGS